MSNPWIIDEDYADHMRSVHGEIARFWRRISLSSDGHSVQGRVSDNVHDFEIAIEHDGNVVTSAHGTAHRVPWVTCPSATEKLTLLIGSSIGQAAHANVDQSQQCTHLLDLARLALRHAGRVGQRTYDVLVTSRGASQITASIARDGEVLFEWQVDGWQITAPEMFAGHDLRGRAIWSPAVAAQSDMVEAGLILRRAIFVQRRRPFSIEVNAARELPAMQGVCYSFQPDKIVDAVRPPGFQELP